MNKVLYFNFRDDAIEINDYFKKYERLASVPKDINSNYIYIKNSDGTEIKSEIKTADTFIIFVHDIFPQKWIEFAKKATNRVNIVFMSSAPLNHESAWPRNVHTCGFSTINLNNDRVNAFFKKLDSPDWSLLKPEPSPDYLVASRLLLLACMLDDKIAKECKDSIPKFWEISSCNIPNVPGFPINWDSFMQMDEKSKQTLDDTLKLIIKSSFC